jgi:hypothetical protein
MVGYPSVYEGLRRISYLAKWHRFKVVLFPLGPPQDLTPTLIRWCEELGITFLDLDADLSAKGIRLTAEHWVSNEDPHPNAAYHRWIADFLHRSLAPE